MCQTVCADVDGIGAGASGARSDCSQAVLNSAITKYELLTAGELDILVTGMGSGWMFCTAS